MAPGSRDRITDLHDRALACAPEERRAFLENACNGDHALQEEVESLLRYESDAARFLETPAAVAAGDLARTADRSQMVGRQLGPYTIVAPLGAGGMGGGLSRARQQAGTRRRHQDPAVALHSRPRASFPLRARSPPPRHAQSSAHWRDLRPRGHRWGGGLDPRAGRGPHPCRSPRARTAADRRGPRDCAPACRRARRGARERHRPSRSETGEHRAAGRDEGFRASIERPAREGARLWPRQDDRCLAGQWLDTAALGLG